MNKVGRIQKVIVLSGMVMVGVVASVFGQTEDSLANRLPRRFVHGLGVEARPEYVFPTHPFLRGENPERKLIRGAFSTHFKYALHYQPGSIYDRIYGNVYQGIGLGCYSFGESRQIGNPVAFYLFQGARIARICPWLSFNYEWNFGLSGGWKPYDEQYNSYNKMVGSKINAYLNANFYLCWALSPRLSLTSGVTLTHFSNGNTSFPNAGVNTLGGKLGVEYNFYRKEDLTSLHAAASYHIPPFQRHVSYDFVFFGSWRRKGVYVESGKQIASPGSYPVAGFNFAPMYNLNYKLRFGVSLDGVYDGSANVYTEDRIVEYDYDGGSGTSGRRFLVPGIQHQLALGLSGRAEYVMPFFTIGVGLGTNVLGRGDLRGLYQVFALKIDMTRSSFLHIGYNLQNFQTPNYLMLGLGFRFNNKYPKVRH